MAGLLVIHDTDGHPEHKLKLEKSEVPFICGGCKELGFGLRYQWTRICDICALDIRGFLYQCSRGDYDLHPHCASLPLTFTLPGSNEVIKLREKIESRCLKCQRKERASGRVQGLSYVSSDGMLCYHVACLKEACLDNWTMGYFQLDALANEERRILALQNLAPNQEVRIRAAQSANAMRGIRLLITFLKLVVSAILGEPFTLVSTLFQISQS
ncbi:hypothetical protein Godav_024189 [Gossypium davidsonii]|uniref:DC1 domain-containing protein n=1 Tax=Gossypium davidsonii TaxID=34287 RepID=A0A7J8SU74_GOSDV|nr:hypothetical protein [Gossypium davidsonii]